MFIFLFKISSNCTGCTINNCPLYAFKREFAFLITSLYKMSVIQAPKNNELIVKTHSNQSVVRLPRKTL